jgi:hypothetical protein
MSLGFGDLEIFDNSAVANLWSTPAKPGAWHLKYANFELSSFLKSPFQELDAHNFPTSKTGDLAPHRSYTEYIFYCITNLSVTPSEKRHDWGIMSRSLKSQRHDLGTTVVLPVGHDWGMTVSTRGSILPPVKKYCLL